MFKKYSENRFKKKFPGLKQVINNQVVNFDMYGQVPLKYGTNTVYLEDADNKRTVYTDFTVDSEHKYGLKIVYNYPYIITKIKTQFLITMLVMLFLTILFQVLFTQYFAYTYIISFVATLVVYFWSVDYYIGNLGISAYKIEVVSSKK